MRKDEVRADPFHPSESVFLLTSLCGRPVWECLLSRGVAARAVAPGTLPGDVRVVNPFRRLRALREHEVVAHGEARGLGVALAYGAVNLAVHLRRLLQVCGVLDGLAARVEEERGDHVHQRRQDAV